ncbi:MAG: type II restriction endonuclease [Candidatus Muirbacterium halophilum]|nr:type II restriction endonuclease [Candidatus Muirbacterium halophilum]MCK9476163.1 type II restriction endonuclease [Candidatus Muirbacterium halophilum]
MKYIEDYKKTFNCNNSDEVFKVFIDTLKITNTKWNYFVNWEKVFENKKNVEISLNLLNYLIGKENIEKEFIDLIMQYPEIVIILPGLIACRQKKLYILNSYSHSGFNYKKITFSNKKSVTLEEAEFFLEFIKNTGFLELLKSKNIKNVVDYFIGVEVGLDSNGRKNRGGAMMEEITEYFIEDLCKKTGFSYLSQVSSTKIKNEWNIELKSDKSSRRIDFAINNGENLYLIETNFYGGGGSKLKSTAGEYKSMYDWWKNDNKKFIWITDGVGWKTTQRPLRETFEYTDFILNLEMVRLGLLESIIRGNH